LDLGELPVQVDDGAAAGLLVQAVDVLGHQELRPTEDLEAGEGAVRAVGLGAVHPLEANEAARPVAPAQGLALHEVAELDRRLVLPGAALVAVRREARAGAHPGARAPDPAP